MARSRPLLRSHMGRSGIAANIFMPFWTGSDEQRSGC